MHRERVLPYNECHSNRKSPFTPRDNVLANVFIDKSDIDLSSAEHIQTFHR